MIEKHFDRWEDFDDYVREMEREDAEDGRASRLLFRGVGNARWQLETTLDRRLKERLSVIRYFLLVDSIRPQVETLTNRQWAVPEWKEFREWATTYDFPGMRPLPGYDYLVYLRHHGFPSPLLDWSRSRYVAAYFAFAGAQGNHVALFAYREFSGTGSKVRSSDHPQIITLGPQVRSHSRHFLQQSQYTICCRYVEADKPSFTSHEWYFTSHESVVDFSELIGNGDIVWKFTLPASERAKVLKILDAYNLNAFSLFQTEEALLETMALREIELKE